MQQQSLRPHRKFASPWLLDLKRRTLFASLFCAQKRAFTSEIIVKAC